MSKQCIILGGGYSVRKGLEKGLWDKIKGHDVWSLNSAFKTMPYLPTKQLWVDKAFFNHEVDQLEKLHNQGVECIARSQNLKKHRHIKIRKYNTCNNIKDYHGIKGLEKNMIFTGKMGMVGNFALHIAICEEYNEIFLLGYDFGNADGSKNTHFYQDQINKLNIRSSGAGNVRVYQNVGKHHKSSTLKQTELRDYELFSKGHNSKIWNVSPQSNIPFFEKIDYERMFELLNESSKTISSENRSN